MKSQRFLKSLCVVALFATINCLAQPKNKNSGKATFDCIGKAFCWDEVVRGTVTYQWKVTVPGQWFQQKIDFSLVGTVSKYHYEAQAVISIGILCKLVV
jgi:hypothetical protein